MTKLNMPHHHLLWDLCHPKGSLTAAMFCSGRWGGLGQYLTIHGCRIHWDEGPRCEEIAELLQRARGLWDLVVVRKKMLVVQTLFSADYALPLLPISFPMRRPKHGFNLGLFQWGDPLDLILERLFLYTKRQNCSLLCAFCSSVRYLFAAFCLAQIRLQMSKIWPQKVTWKWVSRETDQGKTCNWGKILG